MTWYLLGLLFFMIIRWVFATPYQSEIERYEDKPSNDCKHITIVPDVLGKLHPQDANLCAHLQEKQ